MTVQEYRRTEEAALEHVVWVRFSNKAVMDEARQMLKSYCEHSPISVQIARKNLDLADSTMVKAERHLNMLQLWPITEIETESIIEDCFGGTEHVHVQRFPQTGWRAGYALLSFRTAHDAEVVLGIVGSFMSYASRLNV